MIRSLSGSRLNKQTTLAARRRLSRGTNGIVRKATTTATTAGNEPTSSLSVSSHIPNPARKTTRASIAAAAVNHHQQHDENDEGEHVDDDGNNLQTRRGGIQAANKTGVRNQKLLTIAAKKRAELGRSREMEENDVEVVETPRKLNRRQQKQINTSTTKRQLRSSPNKKDNQVDGNAKTDDDVEVENAETMKKTAKQKSKLKGQTTTARRKTFTKNLPRRAHKNDVDEDDTLASDDETLDMDEEDDDDEEVVEEAKIESEKSSYETAASGADESEREIAEGSVAAGDDDDDDDDVVENEEEDDDSDHDSDEANANYSSNNEDNDDDDDGEEVEQVEDENLKDDRAARETESWNAHEQLNDTTNATNSTYYNVSEESDSDENETNLAQLRQQTTITATHQRSRTPNAKTTTIKKLRRNSTISVASKNLANSSSAAAAASLNCIDINSPRTRSRGSVKINLWTLDVSPVLPTISRKPRHLTLAAASTTTLQTSNEGKEATTSHEVAAEDETSNAASNDEAVQLSNAVNEQHENNSLGEGSSVDDKQNSTPIKIASTPVRRNSGALKSNPTTAKRANKRLGSINSSSSSNTHSNTIANSVDNVAAVGCKNAVVTLHRWLLKTPRRNSNLAESEATTLENGNKTDDENCVATVAAAVDDVEENSNEVVEISTKSNAANCSYIQATATTKS